MNIIIPYLERPLTLDEIIDRVDNTDYLNEIVLVSKDELFVGSEDDFEDILAKKVIGSLLLTDMSFSFIGVFNKAFLLVRVSGCVTSFIRSRERDAS